MIKCVGVRIRLHPLFGIIVGVSFLTGSLIELCTLFFIVIMHECGHLACAKYFKWDVNEIKLLPFGGVLIANHQKQVPLFEEILVSLCGPLQHVWMIVAAKYMQSHNLIDPAWGDFFIEANLYIALLNLWPISPLDGGRIVQSLLCTRMPYYQALIWSIRTSIVLSMVILIYVGFQLWVQLIPLNLCVLGLFLLLTNLQAQHQLPIIFLRFILQRARCQDDARWEYRTICPLYVTKQQKINDVLKLFVKDKIHLIVLVPQKDKPIVIVDEKKIITAYLSSKNSKLVISDLLD